MANFLEAVDHFFNKVDNAIDGTARVVNRHKQVEAKIESARGTYANDAPRRATPPSSSTAIVALRYRIVEALDGETSSPIFIVTDGAHRCETSSTEFAKRICDALNKDSSR